MKRFTTLTDQEIHQVLRQVELYGCQGTRKPMLTALYTFLANIGARISEAVALRWEHFDLERREVTIRTLKQVQKGTRKKSFDDTIPLDAKTIEALLAWKTLSPQSQPSDLVFTISRRAAYNIFQSLLHLACIRPVKMHALRHSAVTRWVRAGNLPFAMHMARHRSLATTSQYTHCDDLKAHLEKIPPIG